MILSVSRRTDIPAFYSAWFMNRIRAGSCRVPNPFRPQQVSAVSLRPEDVDAICFWTRNPRPMLPHLAELDERGYRYFFQVTLLGNPRELDPGSSPPDAAVATFRDLADRIGPERVVWRFDPIVLGSSCGPDQHLLRFMELAGRLCGTTKRVVVSVVDRYRKVERRLRELANRGVEVAPEPQHVPGFERMMQGLAAAAAGNGMAIQSCAEELDLARFGIRPGACIDEELLVAVFGLQPGRRKDPSQRPACGCVVSKDIGMYDSCLFGCEYCYATSSQARAVQNHARHDPEGEALLG